MLEEEYYKSHYGYCSVSKCSCIKYEWTGICIYWKSFNAKNQEELSQKNLNGK